MFLSAMKIFVLIISIILVIGSCSDDSFHTLTINIETEKYYSGVNAFVKFMKVEESSAESTYDRLTARPSLFHKDFNLYGTRAVYLDSLPEGTFDIFIFIYKKPPPDDVITFGHKIYFSHILIKSYKIYKDSEVTVSTKWGQHISPEEIIIYK